MTLPLNCDASNNASWWLTSKLNRWICQNDFEEEFHCKMVDCTIYFTTVEKYNWFILKWGYPYGT